MSEIFDSLDICSFIEAPYESFSYVDEMDKDTYVIETKGCSCCSERYEITKEQAIEILKKMINGLQKTLKEIEESKFGTDESNAYRITN